MKNNPTRDLAVCAMLSAAALRFSYVEMLIPFSIGIPGIKLGFANIVTVYVLYRFGGRYAFAVNTVRIALSALLFGSVFSALYSMAGGIVSLSAMLLAKKARIFSITGVSMTGGVFHNFGQLIAAACVVKTVQVVSYLPILIFSGIAAGIVNGITAQMCLDRIKI